MERFLRIDSLPDLSDKLSEIVAERLFTQADYKRLYKELKNLYTQTVLCSMCDGHPNWSIVKGGVACKLFLFRNWHFCNHAKSNAKGFRRIADELRMDFYHENTSLNLSTSKTKCATSMMEYLDACYDFSNTALKEQHMLIFHFDCRHRQYDSFCRSFQLTNGGFGADIYMMTPSNDVSAAQQSVVLHELGHVLNVRLTKDINVVPEDFIVTFESMFLGLGDMPEANEIFAHCFAMGVMTHPDLQIYDPFIAIHQQDKARFEKYFRMKLKHLSKTPSFAEGGLPSEVRTC